MLLAVHAQESEASSSFSELRLPEFNLMFGDSFFFHRCDACHKNKAYWWEPNDLSYAVAAQQDELATFHADPLSL